MLTPVTVQNKNDQISIYKKLAKVAGIFAIAPPFNFRNIKLVERKRFKLKVFLIALIIGCTTYFTRYYSSGWKDNYNLYLFNDLSLLVKLIMTVEALLGAVFRKQDWKNFFIECTLLTQETISPAHIHFYENIYRYLVLFMATCAFGLLGNYAYIVKIAPSKQYMLLITGVGDLLLLVYSNLHKFIINTFMFDVKRRYDSLNSQIRTKRFHENKDNFFEVIKRIEANALQLHKVTCLLNRIFEYQFLLMIIFAFCFSIEYCLMTYNYCFLQTYMIYLLFLVSNSAVWCIMSFSLLFNSNYTPFHYT